MSLVTDYYIEILQFHRDVIDVQWKIVFIVDSNTGLQYDGDNNYNNAIIIIDMIMLLEIIVQYLESCMVQT